MPDRLDLDNGLIMASPLALLLDEERRSDAQAREVLLLSYSADLGFFETFALGAARMTGARTALISDVRMTTADPRAARTAGRAYLAGHAACAGAFHPKLVVIAGPQRATVAIGSGNTTLAGWQGNAELWTVHRGDPNGCPLLLTELARWLRELPEFVAMSHGSPMACRQTADQLDALTSASPSTDSGVRLVSNLTSPICDALPVGPVDELAVCAPFHDVGARALRALTDRLQPKLLRLSYQTHHTQLDQPALTRLVDDLTARHVRVVVTEDAEQRYRHGKLVEWSIDGRRWALTGSPNLSGPALLATTSDGGNCELGVIAAASHTLLPPGIVRPVATITHVTAPHAHETPTGPSLLGATRTGPGRLMVQLLRPLEHLLGRVEASPAAAPPETWEPVAAVPLGATVCEVAVNLPASSRVRVTQPDASGTDRHSNTVYVLDEDRARQVPGITAAGPQVRTQPVDLFTDAQLAQRFVADMVAFTTSHPAATTRGASTSTSGAISGSQTPQTWQDYLDRCAGRLGQPLLQFALGLFLPLPDQAGPPGTPDAAATAVVDWIDDGVDEREPGLDADTVEEAVSTSPVEPLRLPDLSATTEQIRRAYRRYAYRLVEKAKHPTTGIVDRLLASRMALWITAAGAWPSDDLNQWELLSSAVSALGTADPSDAEPQAGSLAAVILSVLHAAVPQGGHGDAKVLLNLAARDANHLLPAATPELIAGYAELLQPVFGLAVNADTVLQRAADLVQADPIEDALWTLRSRYAEVHRHGQHLLHVAGRHANPGLVALRVVGAAETAPRIGAWAGEPHQPWALCLWQRPDLYLIESGPRRLRWRHYRFNGLTGPAAAAAQGQLPPHFLVPHGAQAEPLPAAQRLLAELAVTTVAPSTECPS